MALSNDDIQRIIAMGGVKLNVRTNTYSPALWKPEYKADNSDYVWLNSNKNNIDNLIQQYPDVLRPIMENTQSGGGFLDNLVGAIASPQGIVALGLAVATGGSSLALTVGEMAMGATAAEAAATVAGVAAGTATATAGAATVGAALVGSATSATLAAISGGDVTKSAIAGAISGGAAANASDIANAVTGGNVQTIATSTGLTPTQVANTISNSITAGVVTASITGGNVTTAITSTLAASGMSAEVQNTITDNLPDMTGTAKVIGNVAGVATKAAVSGTDVSTAIQNSIGQIIGGQITQPTANTTTTSQTDTGNTAIVVTTDPANNTALVMSTDGNVSVVSTTENIQSGSTVTVDPTTKVATVTNAAVTGTTFQPTASGGTVVSDAGGNNLLLKDLPQTEPITVDIGGPGITEDDYKQRGFDINQIPTGFKLAPSSALENAVNGVDPNTGAYYDYNLNAWLIPTPKAFEQSPFTPSDAIVPNDAMVVAPAPIKVLGGGKGDGNVYVPGTPVTEFPLSSLIAKDSVNPSANTTQQIIDFISPTANVANVTITAGSGNQAGANASILADTGGASNIGGVGTGDANVGIISTADNVGNIATSNVSNVAITTGGTNNANVTISDNVTNNAASTANVAPTGNALTSILSPSIIPSKTSGTASGGFGPSSAYLGQALGTTSPDSGLTGNPPVLSGEEGQKRNVWNVESLRNALGI